MRTKKPIAVDLMAEPGSAVPEDHSPGHEAAGQLGSEKSINRANRSSILKHDHDQQDPALVKHATSPEELEKKLAETTESAVETAEKKKHMRRKDSVALNKKHIKHQHEGGESPGCFACFRKKPSADEHAANAAGVPARV
jgi:hypothetical protein